jgi:hypothetical protein
MTALDDLLEELDAEANAPGLLMMITKAEGRDLLSAAREGERLREALQDARGFVFDATLDDRYPQCAAEVLAAVDAALQSEKPNDRP